MIDLEKAYREFDRYLDQFDRDQPKIKLKMIHTDGVVRAAKEIAGRMKLPQEDVELAELVALLHDIGRFEQAKCYNSFEPTTMDHAAYGVGLLFGSGRMIRRFIADESYDVIIRTAIARHSLYEVGRIDNPRTLLHARLIRDADKYDNCRVKLEDSLEVLLGMDAEAVGKQAITDIVWRTCLERKAVVSADRMTKMDYWVSYCAYLFDINFAETLCMIKEQDYVDRIIDRIPYENSDTREKMETLRNMLRSLVECGDCKQTRSGY